MAEAKPQPQDGEQPPLTPLQRMGVADEHADHPAAKILLEAWRVFEAGDRPGARRALQPLLQSGQELPPDIQQGALILKKASQVDRAHLYVGLACLSFFLIILFLVY
jgi:hypothetical protein